MKKKILKAPPGINRTKPAGTIRFPRLTEAIQPLSYLPGNELLQEPWEKLHPSYDTIARAKQPVQPGEMKNRINSQNISSSQAIRRSGVTLTYPATESMAGTGQKKPALLSEAQAQGSEYHCRFDAILLRPPFLPRAYGDKARHGRDTPCSSRVTCVG